MLEENKKEILEENYYLNKRKDARKKSKFSKAKNVYFTIGIILGLLIIGTVYYFSDYSKVFHINVEGNIYTSSEDILKLSGISEESRFLLVNTDKVEKKIKGNPLIKECHVDKLDERLIRISVEEYKMIGYMYELSDAVIILENDERIKLTNDNMYLINKIPLIEGYTSEQLSGVIKGFKDIDYKVIDEISEIHRYPFSYDENMMELVMRDGNTAFVSSSGLRMLNSYYSIVSSIDRSNGKACIYLDELTNSGYISKCPWEQTKEDTVTETKEVNEE